MPATFGQILLVDDDDEVRLALQMLLKGHVASIHSLSEPDSIPEILSSSPPDLVLLDLNFSPGVTDGSEGLYWLKQILRYNPDLPVIVLTAYGDIELAVRAMREGATDFIQKPWQNEKLLASIQTVLRYRQSLQEVRHLRQRHRQLARTMHCSTHPLIGKSSAFQGVKETIRKVAETDANVLILGETGTGKELVARAIHENSPRVDEVFLTVDLGALPETLFESELFGYVKGAFTNAFDDRPGRFEIASGGTLFLDEIGNLPASLQVKLLSILEKHAVTRLGSHELIPVDVRLICATNQPIYERTGQGTFRQDLLFRINTVEIRLPPLRERKEDIPLLVDYFVRYYARKYHREPRPVPASVYKEMMDYSWPGNVRELQNIIERATIMDTSVRLRPYPDIPTGETIPSFSDCNLKRIEQTLIRTALEKHEGNITRAAKELGLSRAALYRRMVKYGWV